MTLPKIDDSSPNRSSSPFSSKIQETSSSSTPKNTPHVSFHSSTFNTPHSSTKSVAAQHLPSNGSSLISSLEQDVAELDAAVNSLEMSGDALIPSLSSEVNKWGKEELSLLYYEYTVAKKITANVWSVTDALDTGVTIGTRLVVPALSLTGEYAPSLNEIEDKIKTQIFKISLAYKIPADLSKIAVMIYKKIMLVKIEKLLSSVSLEPTQQIEFERWLKVENKEVTSTAKDLAIKGGSNIPRYLSTLIRLLQFNAPLLNLSLSWINAVLGPVMGCYDLYKATKSVIKVEKDQADFKKENFRVPGEIEPRHVNPLLNDPQYRDKSETDILEMALKARIHEDATLLREKRKNALLDQRENYEPSLITFLNAVTSSSLLEGEKRKMLEEAGLPVDPEKSIDEYLDSLQEEKAFDNVLASYIDVNSSQPMTDSVRNALKTLTMKKQAVHKKWALFNLTKTQALLAAAVLSCIFTITVSTLVATGVVTVPLLVTLIPLFASLALGAMLMTVGLIKLRHDSPNLFKEYMKGSFIKVATYNIPKQINEIRKGILAIKVLKNSIATNRLLLKENAFSSSDSQQTKFAVKRAKLEAEALRLESQLEEIESKIQTWEAKIEPIAEGIALARWKDFLQEKPKAIASGTPSDIKDLVILNTLEELQAGIMEGTTKIDEDVRKIVKDRLGLDIDKIQGPELQKALLELAP